ncbi:hypothetical protein ACFY3M_51950 [Streptomyces mirabilis]
MPSTRRGTGEPVTALCAGSTTAEGGSANTSATVARASTSH